MGMHVYTYKSHTHTHTHTYTHTHTHTHTRAYTYIYTLNCKYKQLLMRMQMHIFISPSRLCMSLCASVCLYAPTGLCPVCLCVYAYTSCSWARPPKPRTHCEHAYTHTLVYTCVCSHIRTGVVRGHGHRCQCPHQEHTYIYTYTHTRVCIHSPMFACIHTHTHIHRGCSWARPPMPMSSLKNSKQPQVRGGSPRVTVCGWGV